MSDTTINALILIVPVVLGIIAKLVLDLYNARAAALVAKEDRAQFAAKVDTVIANTEVVIEKTEASLKQGDVVIVKSDEIKDSTNGHLSKLTAALDVSNTKVDLANAKADVQAEKILGLEKLMAEMVAAKKDAKGVADEAKEKP